MPFLPSYNAAVGARMSRELFDWGKKRAQVGERQAQLEQALDNLRRVRSRVCVEVEKARRTLRVQPVLIYQIIRPRPQTSWWPWGGLFTEKEAAGECAQIGRELEQMVRAAAYPVEFLPLRVVRTVGEGRAVARGSYDTLLMYPASGPVRLLESIAKPR